MKKVLLIAGGGTLGRYAAKELLAKGCAVDIICLEDNTSTTPNLRFFKGFADNQFLAGFLADKTYDGIINFIHYSKPENFYEAYPLLIAHCDHLIFLSSYRIYADLQHPVTESAPLLLDTVKDEEFQQTENYALPKAREERFLREQHAGEHWTVVRPVISFSDLRFDVFTHSGTYVFDCAAKGEPIELPECAKNLTAGLDWSGNSGKLIAALLFNEKTYGEAYTVSTAPNMKWSEVADIYAKLLGIGVKYIGLTEYENKYHPTPISRNILRYDRLYDRVIDNSKIMAVTGFTKADFKSVEEGIKTEMAIYRARTK